MTSFSLSIRPSEHAGSWYDNNSNKLTLQLNKFLENTNNLNKNKNLKAIISPHAGYRYILCLLI